MKNYPARLLRYKDLISFFIFHARPAIADAEGVLGGVTEVADQEEAAKQFALKLEELGPTFVKLGQLLSTRKDILPDAYTDALERLQDGVEEVSYAEVIEIFEEEIGVSVSKAFREFGEKPIASASLGQTHSAVTREGVSVIVKVQRPGIRKQIVEDLDILDSAAEFIDAHTEAGQLYRFQDILKQFKSSILEELDYRREASNLTRFAEVLKGSSLLEVPSYHASFSSERVLTMDYVSGQKITDLSGVALLNTDGHVLVDGLVESFLHQFIVDGFFHADPHPGNLLLTKDGRITFIDLGMVGRLSDSLRDGVFNVFSGICENKSERIVDVLLNLGGQENHEIDRKGFLSDISSLVSLAQNVSVDKLQFGTVVMRILRICSMHGIILPNEFNLIGKALLNLDRIGVTLAPDFNPSESVEKHLRSIAMQRSIESLSPSDLFSAALQFKDLVQRAPQRLNSLLDNLAENKFRINADVIDETALLQGFQKIANRITMGLIVAALIVGSALMMRVETSFQLFGYPGIAMSLLIVAVVLGSITVLGIFKNDK